MDWLFQGFLDNINWPGIVASLGGAMLAWKLIKDAKKPVLVLAFLALAAFAAWRLWPQTKAQGHAGTKEAPYLAPESPGAASATPSRPVVRPRITRPYARTVTPKKRLTYSEKHAEAIKALTGYRPDSCVFML